MNDDLISRKALKKDIEENSIVLEGVQAIEVDCAKALIDNAPTVEFPEQIKIKCDMEEDKQKLLSALRNAKLKVLVEEERRAGEWIGGEIGHCSICGSEGCASDIWNGCKDGMYCPNCGADLRGGKND